MSPKKKAVALLSGGLDSTVALAEGLQAYDVIVALTFNYGQRAFGKELRASRAIAEYYGIPHEVIALPWLSGLLPKALTVRMEGVDPVIPQEWSDTSVDSESFFDAKPVWVPNRNGLFLNIAAVFAEAHSADIILFGGNAEEAERFPDNTEAFRHCMNEVFTFSTLNHPRIECPVGLLDKAQIIDRAQALGVPLGLIWSCYTDAETQCGHCPSCYRLKQALQHAQSGPAFTKEISFIH